MDSTYVFGMPKDPLIDEGSTVRMTLYSRDQWDLSGDLIVVYSLEDELLWCIAGAKNNGTTSDKVVAYSTARKTLVGPAGENLIEVIVDLVSDHWVGIKGSDMDWNALTARIIAASRVAFLDLIYQERGASFYAFILYTDVDCYTVLPSANSIEKHDERVAKEGVEDPSEIAGYKWSIGEWAYEAWNSEAFCAISHDLSAASQVASRQGVFSDFRERVHSAMIKAMSSLGEEGVFSPLRAQVVFFISSSDYDESFEMENRSAQILNPPAVYAEFLNRYGN